MTIKSQMLILRRAFSIAAAIFVAVFCDHYYSTLHECWVALTVLLVMQIAAPMNLREALQRFLFILIGVFLATVVYSLMGAGIFLNVIIITIFIIGYYFQQLTAAHWIMASTPLILAIIFLLLLAPFNAEQVLYPRLHDVVLGGVLAILATLLIFPRRADVDFRTSLVPVFAAFNDYLIAISELFCADPDARANATEKKIAVENILQAQRSMFPDWVYAVGFNPALQEGHRHFLIRVEQLGQILFAMHYVARQTLSQELLVDFCEPVKKCIAQAEKLIMAMIARLQLKDVESIAENFSENIMALEKTFHRVVQVPLELLDLSKDYVTIAAFIFDLKDLQKTLLTMAEALR